MQAREKPCQGSYIQKSMQIQFKEVCFYQNYRGRSRPGILSCQVDLSISFLRRTPLFGVVRQSKLNKVSFRTGSQWSLTHCIWKLSEVGTWKGHDGWLWISGLGKRAGKGDKWPPLFPREGASPGRFGPACVLSSSSLAEPAGVEPPRHRRSEWHPCLQPCGYRRTAQGRSSPV